MELAIPVAKSTASWRVDGFSFQLPVMNGFLDTDENNLVNWDVVLSEEEEEEEEGATTINDAEAPPKRQVNTGNTTAIFMMMMMMRSPSYINIYILPIDFVIESRHDEQFVCTNFTYYFTRYSTSRREKGI